MPGVIPSTMLTNLKKIPHKILIICPTLNYIPTIESEIDFHPKDTEYDLVIYVDKRFKLSIEYPFSIANSEIWFARGSALTQKIFENAIIHYSNCEIRNGL